MRVAIIGTRGYPYVYSGYETFVRELAEQFVGMDIQVTVYCHSLLFKEKPRTVNGVDLVYLPSIETKILSQLSHSFLAMLHASMSSADVVLVVNSANGPLGLITRLFRKKTMINVDGLEWLRPKWRGLGARYFYWASKQATRFYDLVINDSESMRNIYIEEFGSDSEVMAYGAKIRYSKDPDLISRWQLTPEDYYLIIGRMIPDNNVHMMIEAFMDTSSKKKLVIVGDVPYKDEYADKVKSLGASDSRVVFTGYVTDQDELAELYHNAYVYLHGHEFGGTNPTMLKALAYGCAVFALDTVFTREMLQDGKHGLFFEKSKQSLSNLITSHQQQQVAELKKTSREGIVEKYQWPYVARQYKRACEQLLQ